MPHYPSGVPNPYTAHIHPYPTRFHGGIWVRPTFGLPYVRQPLNIIRPSQRGVGSDWDTGTGVFRRPAADGGGLFNQISGLGEMSAAAKTFIGAGVLSFGLVFLLFRKKKTMTANSSCKCRSHKRNGRRDIAGAKQYLRGYYGAGAQRIPDPSRFSEDTRNVLRVLYGITPSDYAELSRNGRRRRRTRRR